MFTNKMNLQNIVNAQILTVLILLLNAALPMQYVWGQSLNVINSTGDILMHVLDDGRVGIGKIPNPGIQFHVFKPISGDALAQIQSVGGDAMLRFNRGGATPWDIGYNNTDFRFIFRSAPNIDAMTLKSNGNVGIGTTGPSAKLDVVGTTELNGNLTVDINTLFVNSATNRVGMGTTGPSVKLHIVGVGNAGDGIRLGTTTGNDGTDISWDTGAPRRWVIDQFGANPDLRFGTAAVPGGALTTRVTFTGPVGTGTVNVFGNFTVTGMKAFEIDHPLEPREKKLVHAALEGPEAAVYYRGEARLVDGEATVELPAYFEALTREEGRTVQLTPIFEGDESISQLASSRVHDGRFKVRALDGQNSVQAFYWEVKAVRKDVEPLKVERLKAGQ